MQDGHGGFLSVPVPQPLKASGDLRTLDLAEELTPRSCGVPARVHALSLGGL